MSRRHLTNPPTVRTDFNRHDVHGRHTVALARFREGLLPRVGDEVLLHDPEGDSVRAIVIDISQESAVVEPVWDTWRSRSGRRGPGRVIGQSAEVADPARRRR